MHCFTVGVSNSGPGRAYAYYSDASSNYDGVLWPSEDEEFQVSPFSARGPVGRFTAKPVSKLGTVLMRGCSGCSTRHGITVQGSCFAVFQSYRQFFSHPGRTDGRTDDRR